MTALPDTVRAAVLAKPARVLLALDFDGTLAHIVADPTQAFAERRSVEALARLGRVLGQIAIVTGRPVHQAIELGGFEGRPGLEALIIRGQYGAERWAAADGELHAPQRPDSVRRLLDVLPDFLTEHGAADARIEDKVLAVAVHTRGLSPDVIATLSVPLSQLGTDLGLAYEPGRQVIELRAPGPDKGSTLRELMADSGADIVIFGGDDLGDLPAFEAVRELRKQGLQGLLLCSASDEQDALQAVADVVLDGPDGIADWLEALADDLGV